MSDASDDSDRDTTVTRRRTLRSSNREFVPRSKARRASKNRTYPLESSDEDDQPSSPKKNKTPEKSYVPELAEEGSSSESDSSEGSEEESLEPINRRTSSRRTPQKNQRASYVIDSSDENDESVSKRPRTSTRSDAGAVVGNHKPGPRSPQKASRAPSVVPTTPPTRKTSESAINSEQRDEEAFSEEESPPRSPKRVAFLNTPSTSVLNGAARTTPMKVNLGEAENLIPTLILSLRTNTSMMGDLAAEVRLLRDVIAEQNRKARA